MLDGCLIVCCILVLMDDPGRLKVMEGVDGGGFKVVSFAVVVEK